MVLENLSEPENLKSQNSSKRPVTCVWLTLSWLLWYSTVILHVSQVDCGLRLGNPASKVSWHGKKLEVEWHNSPRCRAERNIWQVCCYCSILESFGENKCPKVPPGFHVFHCFPSIYVILYFTVRNLATNLKTNALNLIACHFHLLEFIHGLTRAMSKEQPMFQYIFHARSWFRPDWAILGTKDTLKLVSCLSTKATSVGVPCFKKPDGLKVSHGVA